MKKPISTYSNMKKIFNLLKRILQKKESIKTEKSLFSIEKTNTIINLINKLINQPKKELTSAELDHYFEISNFKNLDSIKCIRSRKINEINQYFKLKTGIYLITKRKEKEDKRFSIYIINKKITNQK